MGLPKKTLFFLLMLALTLGAIEGMARVAYWLAYDEPYERKQLLGMVDDGDGLPLFGGGVDPVDSWMRHPFFGFTSSRLDHDLNAVLPRRKREGSVLIGLLGGSVAMDVTPVFESAITRYFAENRIDLEPVIIRLAKSSMKQPQQLLIAAWKLILGGEFDLIVNLDGTNEISQIHDNRRSGVFPFFPFGWSALVETTAEETMLMGHIKVLRDEQEVLRAGIRESGWFWSAAFGLDAKIRLEKIESRIRALHHELTKSRGTYNGERHGPRDIYRNEEDTRQAGVEVWHRGSVLLASLAREAGAEYYHFLQPTQYLPGSKPLTERELAIAYDSKFEKNRRESYLLLAQFGEEMKRRNINFFDLTQIFSNNHETLYRDKCCHFNKRGYQLLAEAMLRRILDTTNIPGLAPPGYRVWNQ